MSEPKRGRLVRDLPDGTVRQERAAVDENAVRLGHGAAAEMVEALNVAHAATFNLFYLVRKHYWSAEGAESGDVADFLGEASRRLRETDDAVAERITELGGVPVSTPPEIQEYAPVHLEAEHLYSLRASLEGDLEAYATLAVSYREGIDRAIEAGDETSRDLLAERLEMLEADAHTIERYVEDDALVEVEG
ncbi:MAG: ferritin-like domain-containing protein [Halolamina sp.]